MSAVGGSRSLATVPPSLAVRSPHAPASPSTSLDTTGCPHEHLSPSCVVSPDATRHTGAEEGPSSSHRVGWASAALLGLLLPGAVLPGQAQPRGTDATTCSALLEAPVLEPRAAAVPLSTGTTDAGEPTAAAVTATSQPAAQSSPSEAPRTVGEISLATAREVPQKALPTDPTSLPGFLQSDLGGEPAVLLPAYPAQHYGRTLPLLDCMLDPSIRAHDRLSLQRDLGALPENVLRRLAHNNTRIYVVYPNQEPTVPARLLELGLHGERSTPTGDLQEPWGRLTETLGGTGDLALPDALSFAQIATLRGFASESEQARFVAALQRHNPGLDAQATLPAGTQIVVPDVWLYQGLLLPRTVMSDVLQANRGLQRDSFDGLYLSATRLVLLRERAVPDPAGGQGRHRVAIHEIGHAYDFQLMQAPEGGGPRQRDMEALHAAAKERAARGQQGFVTDYASSSTVEHYADAFEAYFTREDESPASGGHRDASRADLQRLDPAMEAFIARDLAIPAPRR